MNKSFITVLGNKDFRRLWLAQITSQVSLNMLYFVLVLRVYLETRSNIVVSLMLLSFAIPSIIFGVIAGSFVDYLDKRKVLILCNLFRAFLLIAFFLFTKYLFLLFILAISISIVTQFFIPAEAPSIPSLVSESELLTANSLFTISFYLSTVFGFILSGPMVKIFGHTNIYLLMSTLMFLASYFVFKLPKLKAVKNLSVDNFNLHFLKKTIDEGIAFIKNNQRIKQSLILMTFSQVLIVTLSVLAPGFSDRVLAIDLNDSSFLVMGPAATGLIIGAFWVGAYGPRFLKGSLIITGIIFSGITLILLSLVPYLASNLVINNLILSMVILTLLGFFNSWISVPANTILQEDSLSNMRGRVYGMLTSLTGGVSFIPVVFSGLLTDIFGVRTSLFVIGCIVVIISFYHIVQRKKSVNYIQL